MWGKDCLELVANELLNLLEGIKVSMGMGNTDNIDYSAIFIPNPFQEFVDLICLILALIIFCFFI